ncbi:MAG: PIG-L deacetylase family protein [Trebonia sp.]
MNEAAPALAAASHPERLLPAWASVLAVVAHPDDESFGLGAVIDRLVAGGTSAHVLRYTHGEASTLNETRGRLRRAREDELRSAAAELGAASVTLLGYPDGRLAEIPPAELAAHAASSAAR